MPRVIWFRNGRPFPLKSRSWTAPSDDNDDREDQDFFVTVPYGTGLASSKQLSEENLRGGGISTYANITIPSLTRADVQTELTCQASNFEATKLRTSVEIDMKCKWQLHN